MEKISSSLLGVVLLSGALSQGMAADQDALARAADRLGVEDVQSLEFSAHGRYFQFSQAPAPELPWPAFEVPNYSAALDYSRSAVHAKYFRRQVVEPGRARPPSEQTVDQFALGAHTWNLIPAATPVPANLAERMAELWASPQGFVKAALKHHATVRSAAHGRSEVEFMLDAKYRFVGTLSGDGDVLSVRTFMDSTVLGDTPIEWRYSGYRDFNGVRFPEHIERLAAGFPWYDLRVTDVIINRVPAFEVPSEVLANPLPTVTDVKVTVLAPGVWHFGGTTHHSVVIEQADGLTVIEAPLSEERSLAVLAKIAATVPGKKVKRVINTHTHFDHAGGLRTYADVGAAVVTHARNAAYYSRAWSGPRTLNPDRLATSKRRPRFATFTDKLVLADAVQPIEVHAIVGSGHNDAFAMVWLPAEKILVEADAFTPPPVGAKPGTPPNPLWVNLYANIERLKLPVERIAPLHGEMQTIDSLRFLIGKN